MTRLKPKFIKSDNCISEDMLPREVCAGSCETHESSYIKVQGLVIGTKVCKCCSAEETYTETVKMTCDGKSVDTEYVRISKCKCEICGGSRKNNDLD